ncbi:uncharacterized protein LOC126904874 [Daktulosphaira vitifoliae]|uniref:uncharacterized protein LOC126904874 n=1 Tax=Daktulosphaira vitifoliae TaxID=58002 RepID=UPI0021A9A2DA|nr:uncharacterized protein LOC126904874 [Daktulosphaira vitifoliae]XP_050540164.1 uncharacterized protein LOC126904874 [Daktulosphaira vitifoliae]XP_050540165.1 uncharacterized protein LOC126904874 [Daktulosphaira vitifoliae]XP_050540166.1 uncharacterized protein LOC126904874 [Daktulosphaira vitifoliae]XP_050540167.1 uncharacterized protein LOC126904874 [Daktulosphaira vitifoliae]
MSSSILNDGFISLNIDVNTKISKNHDNQLLDDSSQQILKQIKENYESVFSWGIKEKCGSNQNLLTNIIDKITEKHEMLLNGKENFFLKRFHYCLIICYELFLEGRKEESLIKINELIQYMEKEEIYYQFENYIDAFKHVAYSTHSYILTTLNMSSNKNLDAIKQKSAMNKLEQSTLCAIKSIVFVEYPPKGNDISLDFALEAKTLNSEEPEWLNIWLKAKGRVRRFYSLFEMPDKDEFLAANILSSQKNPRCLIQATNVYMEAAKYQKRQRNRVETKKLYTISSELIFKAIDLVGENLNDMHICLLICIDLPKEYHVQDKMNEIINKLTKFNNVDIDSALGKYYFKHEKDYIKAKIHLSRGMSGGNFGCAMLLLKVDCILQPIDKFPFVKTLNMMCDIFTSPKWHLSLISQILLYEYYYGNDPRTFIYYLRMYLDEEIDDSLKKRQLIHTYPTFNVNTLFLKQNQFLNNLVLKVENLKTLKLWSDEERLNNIETFKMFEKMLKFNILDSIDINACSKTNDNSILIKSVKPNKGRIGSGRFIGSLDKFENTNRLDNCNKTRCERKTKRQIWQSEINKIDKNKINSSSNNNIDSINENNKSGPSYCNNLFDHSRKSEKKNNWRNKAHNQNVNNK